MKFTEQLFKRSVPFAMGVLLALGFLTQEGHGDTISAQPLSSPPFYNSTLSSTFKKPFSAYLPDPDDVIQVFIAGDEGFFRFEQTEPGSSSVTFKEEMMCYSSGSSPYCYGNQPALTLSTSAKRTPMIFNVTNDGTLEGFMGDSSGQLYYVKFTKNSSGDYLLNSYKKFSSFYDVGDNSAPMVAKESNDTTYDLIVGDKNGNLRYVYATRSSTTSTSFTGTDKGKLTTDGGTEFKVTGYSSPTLLKILDDGTIDTLVAYSGSSSGYLRHVQLKPGSSTYTVIDKGDVKTTSGSTFTSGIYPQLGYYGTNIDGTTNTTYIVLGDDTNALALLKVVPTSDNTTYQVEKVSLTVQGVTSNANVAFTGPAVIGQGSDGTTNVLLGNYTGTFEYVQLVPTEEYVGCIDDPYDDSGECVDTYTTVFYTTTDKGVLKYSGGTTVDVGSYSTPTYVETTSDGKIYLVSGGSGGYLYRVNLTPASSGSGYTGSWTYLKTSSSTYLDVGSYSAPTFIGKKSDGTLKFLVGDSDGYVHMVEITSDYKTATDKGFVTDSAGAKVDFGAYVAPTYFYGIGDEYVYALMGNNNGTVAPSSSSSPTSNYKLYTLQNNGTGGYKVGTARYVSMRIGYYPKAAIYDLDPSGGNDEEVISGSRDGLSLHAYTGALDPDGDGVSKGDNCIWSSNSSQTDSDGDGLGDYCDNCDYDINPDQANEDGDSYGDVCDKCPSDPYDQC